MNQRAPRRPVAENPNCTRTRLAEGALSAVDICECGMMQLHVGAFTVRLEPAAVSDVLATLGEAVAEYSALELRKTALAEFPDSRRGRA
jgi:hypothetical protein